jgi:hypothetical protein
MLTLPVGDSGRVSSNIVRNIHRNARFNICA